MASKIKTYVDACVLIAAANGTEALSDRAMRLLDDADREFVYSQFLELETRPNQLREATKAAKGSQEQVAFEQQFQFVDHFFQHGIVERVSTTEELLVQAMQIVERHPVKSIDAIHAAVALSCQAQFVTAEKLTKPLHAVENLQVVALESL